jgi:DNA polymerase III delta prime subunit
MQFKQEIPWYKNGYLEKDWLITKSPHYIFHDLKNSLAHKEINKIIKIKERDYKKIISFLKIKNSQKIKYFLYPDLKEKKKLMGSDDFGNAIWEECELLNDRLKTKRFEIHVLYAAKIKFIGEHEDTHLLSLYWGLPPYLFSEGLCQFMEGKLFGKDVDILSKRLIERNKIYSLKFVRYLINTYGLEKFKKIYKKLPRNKAFREKIKIIENIYSKSIQELEKEWKRYLIDLKE